MRQKVPVVFGALPDIADDDGMVSAEVPHRSTRWAVHGTTLYPDRRYEITLMLLEAAPGERGYYTIERVECYRPRQRLVG